MQPVFLHPLVDQLTGFGQVSTIAMLKHIFTSYGAINKINLEENKVTMMGSYDPAEPLSHMINQLGMGR